MQQVDSNINQFNKLVQIICQNNNPKFVDNQDIEFESSIQNEVHSMLQDIDTWLRGNCQVDFPFHLSPSLSSPLSAGYWMPISRFLLLILF